MCLEAPSLRCSEEVCMVGAGDEEGFRKVRGKLWAGVDRQALLEMTDSLGQRNAVVSLEIRSMSSTPGCVGNKLWGDTCRLPP